MSDAFDRKLVAPLIAGAVLNPVNSTIVSVALVPIGLAFGEPPSATAWLISGLYLATAVGQPVAGRLIDVYGPRRLFLPATALVGLAGVIGAAAPDLAVLVIARVVLGLGTCAGYPAAMRLIRDEGERTGIDRPAGVLTALAIATQTIAVIGPPLGGLMIGVGGWRTTLAINIPLAAVAFVLAWRRFPRVEKPTTRPDLDLPGVALFAGALVALLVFVMAPRTGTVYLLVVAALAAAGFIVRELTHREPFIDVRVLGGDTALLVTYGRALLAYVVSYCVIYGLTQWLEDGRALTPAEAGLVTLPMFASAIVVSAATGRRESLRAKLIAAAIGQIAVCVLLLLVGASTPVWALVLIVMIFGVPQGLNSIALQNAVYRQTDPERIGAAAGLLRTFGYLGAITAAAAQGGFYADRADTAGLHHMAVFLVAVSALYLLVNVLDRALTRPRRTSMADRERLDPARTALLVMDYQTGIVGRIPGAEALMEGVDALIGDVRARGGCIGWVRVGFDDEELAAIPAHSVMAQLASADHRAGVHADAAGTQIHDRLHPQPDDIVVRKTRVGAFTTTDLDRQLRDRDISTLLLAGISTSGVVLSTVREAMDRDYRIVVVADLCADPDADTHTFLTGRLFPRHATVVTAEGVAELWA